MKYLRLFILLALFAALGPAQAKIDVGLNLGVGTGTASTTAVITATNTCGVGSFVVLASSITTTTESLSSVADSSGNTWATPIDNTAGTGVALGIAYAKNIAVALTSDVSTITATYTGTVAASKTVAVCYIGVGTGVILDVSNQTSQGMAATTNTTVNTGLLSSQGELVLGITALSSTSGAITGEPSGFTLRVNSVGVPSVQLHDAFPTTNASIPFTVTWTNARNYVADVISFRPYNTFPFTPAIP